MKDVVFNLGSVLKDNAARLLVSLVVNHMCNVADETGFCGNGKEYCEAPDCQLDYGPACDGLQTPIGASTIGIKRPLVGNVPYGGNGIFSCTVPNTFALTFDDGPWKYTDELLDLLEIYNAKATFFMTGNNNGKGKISNTSLPWPTILKRMDADGHQIASHTWSHQDLSRISPARRAEQIIRNEMAFRNVLGKFPTYMRPPYSSCTVASGCEADMRKFGYHIVYFDLDTADYLNDAPNLIQNSKNRFLTALDKGESNYLAIEHDIHQQTVQNLTEYMLQSLGEEGYSAVTVGACLGDPKANWYRSVAVKSQGPRLRDEVAQPELYTRDAPNSTLPLPTPGGLSPSPSADCIAPMDCFRSHRGGCMDCRAADL